MVNWAAPLDNGGRPVTGYIVTSYPGNITAATADTTIIVTGLTNYVKYTFTVKAINELGSSMVSENSNYVTPYKPSSTDNNTAEANNEEASVNVLINGKVEKAATVVVEKVGEKTVTEIIIIDEIVNEQLKKENSKAVLTITDSKKSDVFTGTLNGQTVKNLEEKEAVIEVRTREITYTIPASEINIDNISKEIGEEIELKDIKVKVKITDSGEDTIKVIEDSTDKNKYQLVIKPVEFEITCTNGDRTVEVSRFNSYVERTIAVPAGVDPDKITTAAVLNSDGSFTHIPTKITIIDGRYYAEVRSLTNSTYTVIWNPKAFSDIEGHWAEEDIIDMSSRLVLDGTGNGRFEPDRFSHMGKV